LRPRVLMFEIYPVSLDLLISLTIVDAMMRIKLHDV